jgi:putative phosphoesterase
MFIAIISDIHNNKVNLKTVLGYCTAQKIQTIICCGDLASDETLDFMNDNFNGKIHYTFGNADTSALYDIEPTKEYKNTFLYKNFGETEIDNKKISFVHYPDAAKKLCETGKYDFVFYGHTHKPWVEKIDSCTMLNPGNVAGEIYLPTFAVWNTESDKFELIRIHNLK